MNNRLSTLRVASPSRGAIWTGLWCLAGAVFLFLAFENPLAAGFFFVRPMAGGASSPPALSRLSSEGRSPSVRTKSIEKIAVGERVAWANNPGEPFDSSLGTDVDPANWRKIRLRVDQQSAGQADVVLLRPQWWIDERLDSSGQRLSLSIPEVGIHGPAEVLGIDPCPPISGGHGQIVIGTFSHFAPATVAVLIEDLDEPIRSTADHPYWSHDRQAFVEAQSLSPSERVRGTAGLHRVRHIEYSQAPAAVYNLEILGQHVYQVSRLGVLVHNAPSRPSRMQRQVERGQAPREVVRVEDGHIPGQEPHVHYRDGTSSTVSGGVHDAHNGYPNPSNGTRAWLESHEWTPPPRR